MIIVFKGVENMKRMEKKFLSLALLISACALQAASVPSAPVVSQLKIRPQSLNGARKVAGEAPNRTHLTDRDEWYSYFSITPEYQKSFRASNIAQSLFGDSLINSAGATTGRNNCDDKCAQTVLVQGSNLENRNENAWVAQNFYLPNDFDGALTFKPTISNFILDFNFYGGLDMCVKGMYFRVYAPFVHTKWNLNMTETVKDAGTNFKDSTFTTATEFFAGQTPPALTLKGGAADDDDINVTRNPLLVQKMNGSVSENGNCESKCSNGATKNGFGEIRGEFGWDFLRCDNYHLGFYAAAAAPTGSKPKACLLFEPIVGNNKHWELGAGFTGHWATAICGNENHNIGVYADMVVTHLFKAKEHRVFDLKGKPLSRYMLAAKMDAPISNNLTGTPADPALQPNTQFANEYTPIANLTAQDVNVSVGAQVDLTAWLNYNGCGFNVDLGYNLWLQTCEKIACASKCGPALRGAANTWVIAGDSVPYGITDNFINPNGTTVFYPLSFSQSDATLSYGANEGAIDNSGVDKAELAETNETQLNGPSLTRVEEGIPINLSNPPTYLTEALINNDQTSKAMSQKVFANVGYTWEDACWSPSLNIGGEAEFGSSRKCEDVCSTNTKKDDCSDCLKSAVSQWGVWAKVGLAFN